MLDGTCVHRLNVCADYSTILNTRVGKHPYSILPDSGVQGKGILEDFSLIKEDWIREHLGKLNVLRSMGPGRMHPQVQRGLANIIARLLTSIF